MMTEKRKSFLISLAVGAVITAAVCIMNVTGDSYVYGGIPMLLCDGFFVAAVLVLGVGLLGFAKNCGYFDMMTYGVSFVLHTRWPVIGAIKEEHEGEKFVDYKQRKKKERKSSRGPILAGAVYMALATLMLLLYNII